MGQVTIKVYKNTNEKLPKCYGKYYGKVLHRETLDTDDLANHIMSHGTLYTDDVVLGVTRKLMRCIAELLTEGYKVKLDGIGTLYLGASSTGADSSEDFDISKNITRIGVKFLADQSKNSIYTARVMRQSNTLTTKIGLEGGHLVDGSGSGNGGGNDTPNPGAVEEEP
jgi:predicted histone-like DNA-binding protein